MKYFFKKNYIYIFLVFIILGLFVNFNILSFMDGMIPVKDRHGYNFYYVYNTYIINYYTIDDQRFNLYYKYCSYKFEYIYYIFKYDLYTFLNLYIDDNEKVKITSFKDFIYEIYREKLDTLLVYRNNDYFKKILFNLRVYEFSDLFYYSGLKENLLDCFDFLEKNKFFQFFEVYGFNFQYKLISINFFSLKFFINLFLYKIFNFFLLNLYFLIYFSFFIIIYILLLFFFLFFFYYFRFQNFLGFTFGNYDVDGYDFEIIFVDLISYREKYQEKDFFFIRIENKIIDYIITRNKGLFFWYHDFKEEKIISQNKFLKFNITQLVITKIEQMHWNTDEGDEDDWLFFPFMFFDRSFVDYENLYNLFYKNELQDIIYFKYSFFKNFDIYGSLEFDNVLHPFNTSNILLKKNMNVNLKSLKNITKMLFSDDEYFYKSKLRYKKIYKKYFLKMLNVDSSVDYSGSINNKEELIIRVDDIGLHNQIIEYPLFCLDIESFAKEESSDFYDKLSPSLQPFFKELDYSSTITIKIPRHLRFIIEPSVWRFFSEENFYSIILIDILLHLIIRDRMYWEEMEDLDDTFFDGLEEDIVGLQEINSKLFESHKKESSFFYGNDVGKFNKDDFVCLHMNNFYKNLEKKEFLKYPPFEPFIGIFFFSKSYRIYFLEKKNIYKSKLNQNIFFSNVVENTYFIGYTEFPMGFSYEAFDFRMMDSLYKNSFIEEKKVLASFENQERFFYIIFYVINDILEFLIFILGIPFLIIVLNILKKLL